MLWAILCAVLAFRALCSDNVLMRRHDQAQTGAYTNELVLNPTNVNSSTFGKLFHVPVDGVVYAQPLIFNGVEVPGKGVRNVLYVATEHDSVYAFDLDQLGVSNDALLWKRSFIDPTNGITTVNPDDVGGKIITPVIVPEIGITGTPVIDQASGTLFVVAKTEVNGTNFFNHLHAMDVATGEERTGSPVLIEGSSPGTGDGSDGTTVPFLQQRQMNRTGLIVVTNAAYPDGIVYIGFTSHNGYRPQHGWLFGYDVRTLEQVQSFVTTPNGYAGAVWMSCAAPAADDQGNLYLATGNGPFNPASNNYGDTVLKFDTTSPNLNILDYFAPSNADYLEFNDKDLGSGGITLLPESVGSPQHPHLALAAGKFGSIFLLDRDDLGHFNPLDNSQAVQELPAALGNSVGAMWGSPAYFNGSAYYHANADVIKQFRISDGLLSTNPVSKGRRFLGYPGATPSVSANGTSNGIVWEVATDLGQSVPATVMAYSADSLTNLLYTSLDAPGGRDTPGNGVKYVAPVINGGKVYITTADGVDVFGLLDSKTSFPILAPLGGRLIRGSTVSIVETTPGAEVHFTLDGSEPTEASPLYSTPFVIQGALLLKARAFTPGLLPSEIATGSYTVPQNGFIGRYWVNQVGSYDGPPTATQVETGTLYYLQSPNPALGSEAYSAKWNGQVKPQFSETYAVKVGANGGIRLWFGGKLLIDEWFIPPGPTHDYTVNVDLVAGNLYDIELDYFKNPGDTILGLAWSSPSRSYDFLTLDEMVIGNVPPDIGLVQLQAGISATAPASVTLTANASDSDGSVTNVAFFHDGILIGSSSTAPYSITWTGVAQGTYSINAVAYDDGGASGTSGPVSLTVFPGDGQPLGIESRAPAPGFLALPHDGNSAFPPVLSQTGVFTNTSEMGFSTGIVPYAVNSPFWSDGAIKSRWLMVPFDGTVSRPDQQISFSAEGKWVYPVGSVFVKHFDYATNELDLGSIRRLETRLIEVTTNGRVVGATYKWRPDYSDADLITNGLTENLLIQTSTGLRTQLWYYPQPSDCLVCHTPESGGVLGASFTRQLNGVETYPSGVHDNQLHALNRAGYFNPAIDETAISNYTRLAAIGDTNATIEMRARSFLDVNCAYCHFPGGTGRAVFDARLTTPLADSGIINGLILVGASFMHPVTPGDENRSAIYQRVNTLDDEGKMPPIARNSIDTAAVDVLGRWIDSLVLGPAPVLTINVIADGLLIQWDNTVQPFYLQKADTLGDPNAWSAGPEASSVGSTAQVVVPATDVARYYRLTSQAP